MKSSRSSIQETLSRTESLACIPLKNDEINWQKLDNGEIIFTYAIPLSRFFIALHQKFRRKQDEMPTKKLQLDQMGSFVWNLIDGKNTVKDIIRIFAHDYRVTSQEAETAVAAFLKTLGQRGFIALYDPREAQVLK
ncbi:MAG: PqqD family protein [Desulfocapsa sp.]|nr:PqqD family protein [Desulfocapsa sp.]MBN4048717.1 PqqD family protein [bacterium AH-315-N22]